MILPSVVVLQSRNFVVHLASLRASLVVADRLKMATDDGLPCSALPIKPTQEDTVDQGPVEGWPAVSEESA